MSMTIRVEDAKTAVWSDYVRDLLELSKPRISAMVLFTVAISVFVASSGRPDVIVLVHTLLGTALVAASSGAFNPWLERRSDLRMDRTSDRPLPSGRMGSAEVLSFGTTTLVVGTAYLAVTVGWQPVFWSLGTWGVYVCLYTPMKPLSSWNTAVGAVSGALPILIGWSAASSPMSWRIGAMLAVLFFWQFPHFLAIAWIYRRQYAKAGLRMITVTDPSGRKAGVYSVLGASLLVISSLLPLLSELSIIYGAGALLLGIYLTAAAWRFHRQMTDVAARELLKASIIYLPLALGLIAAQTAL